MPPFRQFWLVYFLFAVVFLSLLIGGWFLASSEAPAESQIAQSKERLLVLFGGVVVAAVAILANAWSQWRSNAVAHAMSALQTLRTDREYLINAYVVRQGVGGTVGKPLSREALQAFDNTQANSCIAEPSFRDASLFVLNQYEFLAAAIRSGAADYHLVRSTMRGPIISLVDTYAPAIRTLRAHNPRSMENLLWLYRRMRDMPPYDRGGFS